jgi:ubiquinone/menaquinone biosynthesis C-methylase UbiE
MTLKLVPLFLSLMILTPTVGCSGLERIDVSRLVTSGRDGWQHPERVIESLEIEPGDRVAEIGAGSGYWLPWLSSAVGPEGRVYAVEVEAEKVMALEAFVHDEALENVTVVFGDFEDPKLPDAGIDLALTCLTYHHIEDRVEYFERLQLDLAAGGRVAHLDDRPDSPAPISWFQGEGHWTAPDAMVQEMGEAGYHMTEHYDFLPAQSFQVFVPDGATGEAGLAVRPAARRDGDGGSPPPPSGGS